MNNTATVTLSYNDKKAFAKNCNVQSMHCKKDTFKLFHALIQVPKLSKTSTHQFYLAQLQSLYYS